MEIFLVVSSAFARLSRSDPLQHRREWARGALAAVSEMELSSTLGCDWW